MYTHIISWKEIHPLFGPVDKSFRTVPDALKLHLANLMKSVDAYDIGYREIQKDKIRIDVDAQIDRIQ